MRSNGEKIGSEVNTGRFGSQLPAVNLTMRTQGYDQWINQIARRSPRLDRDGSGRVTQRRAVFRLRAASQGRHHSRHLSKSVRAFEQEGVRRFHEEELPADHRLRRRLAVSALNRGRGRSGAMAGGMHGVSRCASRQRRSASLSGASHGLTVGQRTPADGQPILRGPGFCRIDRQIVHRTCMPKERFTSHVFSAEIFLRLRVI
jgi:hypothetical protein